MINSWTGLVGDQTDIMEFGYDSEEQTQIKQLLEKGVLLPSSWVVMCISWVLVWAAQKDYVQDLQDDYNIHLIIS